MLQKLLKYDLRHVFKYWWILAVASVGISVIGGICFNILYNFSNSPDPTGIEIILMIGAVLGIFVCILGFSAFIIGNEIFIFERFYRNFFTDEGYLTFTLPVKRSQLLNSKILMAFIANTATFAVCFIDVVIFFLISPIRQEFIDLFGNISGISDFNVVTAILGVTIVVIYIVIELILGSISGTLLIFGCITVASVITKKYKLLAAIGIYYAVSAVFSGIIQLGLTFTGVGLVVLLEGIPESLAGISTLIIVIIQILITAVFCLGLYTAQLRLLDKKLNLS